MKGAIICIGNRFVEEDDAGCLVFDIIRKMLPLPEGIELVEGGTAGLNLLSFLERGGRVVFVDAVRGFAGDGELVLLSGEQIVQSSLSSHYGHDAGLGYLLSVLPRVYDGTLPEEIVLLGLEGRCQEKTLEKAARLSVDIAVHGLRGQA